MKISSEIETLLLCANYHEKSRALLSSLRSGHVDINDHADSLQSVLDASETLLCARLAEVGARAGFVSAFDVSRDVSISSLSSLIFRKKVAMDFASRGDNIRALNIVNTDAEHISDIVLGDPRALIEEGVDNLLHTITPKEAMVVKAMFGIDQRALRQMEGLQVLTAYEVANILGWRTSNVERYWQKALNKLRGTGRASLCEHLINFVDPANIKSRKEALLMVLYG